MTPKFPVRFTAEVRDRTDGAEDDFGNPIAVWSEWVEHGVYGWSGPNTNEPGRPGHDREIVDVELLVPPGFPDLSHRAQVRLDGRVYDVIGSPEMYDHSPFGWHPGGIINLRRVVDGEGQVQPVGS